MLMFELEVMFVKSRELHGMIKKFGKTSTWKTRMSHITSHHAHHIFYHAHRTHASHHTKITPATRRPGYRTISPLLSFLSNSIAPHAQRHHHLFTIYPIGSTLKFCFLARRTLIYRSLVLVVLITGIYIDNRRSSLNTNTTNTVGTRVHTQQQSIIQTNEK